MTAESSRLRHISPSTPATASAEELQERLTSPSTLKALELARRCFGDIDLRSATSLDLSDKDLDAGEVIELVKMLESCEALTSLDLSGNNMRDEGVRAVAGLIEKNTTLENVNLSDNDIGIAGAQALGNALQSNHTLTDLNLSENDIYTEGVSALAVALTTNTALKTLNIKVSSVSYGDKAYAELINARQNKSPLTIWV